MNTTSLPKHPMFNPPPLIGITGKARAGKDSLVQIAQALRPNAICRVAIADDLKRKVAGAAGVDVATVEARKEAFRATLQAYGVLMRDLFGQDYWIRQAISKIEGAPDCWSRGFCPRRAVSQRIGLHQVKRWGNGSCRPPPFQHGRAGPHL